MITGFGYDPTFGYYPIHGFGAYYPMPKQPRLPGGFSRWPAKRKVTKVARGAAVTYLNKLPMGGFKALVDQDGSTIAAFKDWHYDNHPKGGGPPFWHPGISMLVLNAPKKVVRQDIPFIPLSRYGACGGWG